MNKKNCKISDDGKCIECSFACANRKIYIETTTRCNNACRHCFNRSGEQSYDLSLDDIIDIEQHFSNFGTVNQVILSGGEFFCNPYYADILDYLAPKYSIKILSNGISIPDKFIDYLVSNRNIELQITLNGWTSKIDGAIRGKCFDKTVSTIKRVIDYGCTNSLTIATTVFRDNIKNIRDMVDFCFSLGVKRIQFSFVYKLGRAEDNWDSISISLYEKLCFVDEIQKLADEYRDKISIVTSGMKHFCAKIDKTACEYSCQELSEELVITPDLCSLLCPKIEAYWKCKGLPALHYDDLSQGEFYVKNLIEDNCGKCDQFSECIASCVR